MFVVSWAKVALCSRVLEDLEPGGTVGSGNLSKIEWAWPFTRAASKDLRLCSCTSVVK